MEQTKEDQIKELNELLAKRLGQISLITNEIQELNRQTITKGAEADNLIDIAQCYMQELIELEVNND